MTEEERGNSRGLKYHNNGDPFILSTEMGMIQELRETAQELFCFPLTAMKLLSRDNILDLTPATEIIQSLSTLLTDGPPLTAGAIPMNQGQDTNLLQSGSSKLTLQSLYGLFHRGKTLLKVYTLLIEWF